LLGFITSWLNIVAVREVAAKIYVARTLVVKKKGKKKIVAEERGRNAVENSKKGEL
jgi:hypothetical protein